jgi:hypothetical protein
MRTSAFHLAAAGSTRLLVGAFLPLITIPILGKMNYIQKGTDDGIIVLALAADSAFLTAARKYRGLLATGLATLALLAFTCVIIQAHISRVHAEMEPELSGDAFATVGQALMQTVQL